MDRKELATSLVRRFESLRAIRERRDAERWEAFAYMNHRTETGSITPSPVPKIRLYSTAGQIAGENFINGFMGNLVSVNQNWASFRYESNDFEEQDDITGANQYLGICQRRVMSELSNSNFYAQDRLAAKDSFFGGCSATFIHNDPKRKICVFDTLPPWEWWCDMDENGNYDTFFYKKTMSAYKAYQMFGDKLPDELIKAAKMGQYEIFYDFLMCIYPREGLYDSKGDNIFGTKKRFACVWLFLGSSSSHESVISIDGFDQFPVIIHAWDSDGDNPYGTSPVIRALPDLRRLNMLSYETALSVQKVNHSPYVMTKAVSEKFSDDPGARIVVPTMEQRPVPLEQSQAIDAALEVQKEQIEYIQRIFYNDMFNYLSRQDKVFTATQVNAVKNEEMSLLAAIFGNVQKQKIEPTIKYVIYLMSRNGRLPKGASSALSKGGKLHIVLDSMLAQSLRAYTYRDSGIATLEIVERFANISQIVGTDPIKNIDLQELIREIVLGNGSDSRLLVDKQIVKAQIMQEQMLAQQQMQQQQMMAESEMVRNMGGASNMNNSTGANQYT